MTYIQTYRHKDKRTHVTYANKHWYMIYKYVDLYIYICICNIYINIHMYTYMFTYVCMYIHIHIFYQCFDFRVKNDTHIYVCVKCV